jgi:ligand-binding SRPBCC domain-containing protein
MTVLDNSIRIDAPREAVWSALTQLDALPRYDPGVKRAHIIGPAAEGEGASRRVELKPAGWFAETVTAWDPPESIAFELTQCSLHVRRLHHSYILTSLNGGTELCQRMSYELKFGPLGRLLDSFVMRRRWDTGIKAFMSGLKSHIEAAGRAH